MGLRKNCKPEKVTFAREMRKNPTPAERTLWEELRNRRLKGLKFRRQAIILGWIVDFYCPSKRLVVELDGGIHKDMQQDELRDKVMISHRLRVLRIANEDVKHRLKDTLTIIYNS